MEREPFFRRYRRFWGADPKRDVDEELAFHLAMRTEEYRRAGMSDDEAEEATMQRFGNMRHVRNEVEEIAVKRHARRRRAWQFDALRQDLRFAWRTFIANPGYSIVVALTLALGIGANAAVFSVAYGVLLRPLPYDDANSLVRVWSKNMKLNLERFSVSPDDYFDWKTQSRAFSAMAAFERQRDATLTTRGDPVSVSVANVTSDIFALLGAAPVLGRTLVADDARADASAVVVMSHALWITQFGDERSVVGSDVMIDGKRYTVVGVMPARFLIPGTNAELWTSLPATGLPTGHGYRYLRVLGRLAPGVTLEAANAQLDVIAARTAIAFPRDAANWSTSMMGVPEMIIGTSFRRAVLALGAVVAMLLIIACANAANLQLARGAVRDREFAIRSALGASRGRVTLQLLTESVLISIVGGIAGLALAYGGVALLRAIGTTTVPRLEDVKVDAPVLWFTGIVAIATGILFGLIPAIRSSRADVADALKGSCGSGRSMVSAGIRNALVVAEISLSLVLLIGAGLVIRSLEQLRAVDLGFDARGVVIARTALPQITYPTAEGAQAFFQAALDRVRALSGVESAALVSYAPFAGPSPGLAFVRLGREQSNDTDAGASFRVISPGYFRTMGPRLLRGREFTPEDRTPAPSSVIISSEMARKYWPGEEPIGQRIRVGDVIKGTVVTIVGVVDDMRYQTLDADGLGPMMYFSWYDASFLPPQRSMTIVARVHDDAARASIRSVVASLDRRLPPPSVTPISRVVESAMAPQRFASTLFGAFAMVGIALAVIGLYGVLSYLVRQRTHELGIRVALGAPRRRLLALVVGGAIRLTIAGVVVGLLTSYALTRWLGTLLFGVSPTDRETFVVLSLLLGVVAVIASLIPAMRAMRADPMAALRGET
ncbi:MAG TPA: ABC transporter permease [Gemmatimonadaceae bacterium]